MSHPPGHPAPDAPDDEGREGPVDPWAAPPPDQPPPVRGASDPGGPASHGQVPYGQPPYGQAAYGQPPYGPSPGYPPPTNGMAQAALWTGVFLLVLSCCGLGIFGFLPVFFGVRARREIRASGGGQSGEGMALAGIVTGALAMVLSLVMLAVLVLVLTVADGTFDTYGSTSV